QFGFRLVDAGDIVEGDARGLVLVVALGLALAEAEHAAGHPAAPCSTPDQPDVEGDEQNRGTEAEEERRPAAAADLDRLCADLHLMLDQKRLEPGVHEGGNDGPERDARARLVLLEKAAARPGFRRCLGGSWRRISYRRPEPSFDLLALAVDCLDV